MKIYKDGYMFVAPSKKQFKKYDVYKDGEYITSFGDKRYGQYRDRVSSYYRVLDNNDPMRRQAYHSRHPHNYGKDSADYMAKKWLW